MTLAEPAHSPFGGSIAARVLRCPASVGLTEKVPAYLRKVSAYAARGTALHTAMASLIDNARSLDDLAGEMINGYTIAADDVENALRPAYAYVETLLDAPGAGRSRACRDFLEQLASDLVGVADGGGPHLHLALVEVPAVLAVGQAGDGQGQRQQLQELVDDAALLVERIVAHGVGPFGVKRTGGAGKAITLTRWP